MEIDLKRLGENIRYERQGRDWSLSDLAEHSGVSKAYISGLENGAGGRPNIQYVYRIALALGTTIDTLVNQSLRPVLNRNTRVVRSNEPLPPGLAELAESAELSTEEIEMLSRLNFRGNRPKDAEAWKLIYDTIKIASRRQE